MQKTVNGVTTNYLYSGDLLMRQTDGTNTMDFQYDASGNIIGFIYNGVPYYYLRNLMNDVSGIVDGNGDIVAKYRYDAYGNTILATGTMAAINPIRYRGYYFDAETNWYYLNSRYYSPEWSRFISPDSLFITGEALTGSNMYAYCYDNPIMFKDDSGALPTISWENVFETVWQTSKGIADTISCLPVVPDILTEVSNGALSDIIDIIDTNEEKDFMKTTTGKVLAVVLGVGSHLLLAHLPPLTDINPFATGLRHLMPINMDFVAPWAGYFLGFKEKNYGEITNYTSDPTVEMWQSYVGYTPTYDLFFSLGGPIRREKYEFSRPNPDPQQSSVFPNEYYVVWIWKGDYWNLGAGAEIGFYYTPVEAHANRGFYEVVTDKTLYVDMEIKYNEETLNHFEQENWWVCSFTPEHQLIDINLLKVLLKVKFTDPTLRDPFYNECEKRKDTPEPKDDWKYIIFSVLPPYDNSNINDYQFELDY